MIGEAVNQYRITVSIGAGGMGDEFRARDTRLNRDVAVKVLPRDSVADADRLRRFEQEAKMLAALNYPNVLTIHDAGVREGALFLVSELLEGKTLREEMNGGALPMIYIQDVVPAEDTTSTRRPLGPFDPENSAESFGISPDVQFITIGTWEQFFSIMVTEDLPSR